MPIGLSFIGVLIYAFRMRALARRERLRAALIEQRESDSLKAVGEFTAASLQSREAVLASLDATMRLLEPAVDSTLIFEVAAQDFLCMYAGGSRALHYNRARYARDEQNLLSASHRAGHRIALAAQHRPLLPSDRAALAIPLGSEPVRAIVYAASSTSELQNADSLVRAVEQAAAPYTLALERERDRNNATYDGLTGLLTPRAFRARLQAEIDAAQLRAAPTVSLWFIDTDHFKLINDTFGHSAGDVVLRQMSKLLRAHLVAGIDIGARNGGDEFCSIIRETQKTVAIDRAQKLCEAVRAFDFGNSIALSASIGVASYPYDASTASELLEVADGAMYHSKQAGRDRVSFATEGRSFLVYR
ncbi:MAG: GGDEF domain-containing protein [Candidatus Eremiobacteraeota bacterium]|nr:GGDEF domain-containing protein [Candidatus Eremiobacteraeota bacterium]